MDLNNEVIFRLNSSANKSTYPYNKPNSFTNKLDTRIENVNYIGMTKLSFQIDPSLIEESVEFSKKNSVVFVNTQNISASIVANQQVNILNEIVLELSAIKSKERLTYLFESDFVFVGLDSNYVDSLDILITNLDGVPHPLLIGTTIITMKAINGTDQETTIRLVSSANKTAYPNNVANSFMNQMIPPLTNVDSIAVAKISIPLLYNESEKVDDGRPVYFTWDKIISEIFDDIDDKRVVIDLGQFSIYWTDIQGSQNITNVKFRIRKNAPIVNNTPSSQSEYLDQLLQTFSIEFPEFSMSSTLDPNVFNVKLDKNLKFPNVQNYDIVIIPGSELLKQIKTVEFIDYNDISNNKCPIAVNMFYPDKDDVRKIIIKGTNRPFVTTTNPSLQLRLPYALYFQWFLPSDINKMYVDDKILAEPDLILDDILFIAISNCEYISVGSDFGPILGVVPITKLDIENKRVSKTFTIPYFLQTNNTFINNFEIKLLNSKFQLHDLVDTTNTTIVTCLVNHGQSVGSVRESSYITE